MDHEEHRAIAAAVEGTSHADFRVRDWGQLGLVALIFGSGFLFIAVSIEALSPGVVSFGKAALGGIALAFVPAARHRIGRPDWGRLVLAALLGMAAPTVLLPLAQQRIPSALAGMMVSSIPIFTAIVAAIETRTLPRRLRLAGLAVGFAGIILLTAPNLTTFDAEAVGLLLALGAMAGHSVASTIYAPLQQSYGSLPVAFWLTIASAVIMLPLGIAGLGDSTIELKSVAALVVLGIIGTGLVWSVYLGFIGRVGAVRASIAGYFIPIVALVLGVVVLDESIAAIQVIGVLVALLGGYLLSKGDVAAPSGAGEDEMAPERQPHLDTSCAVRSPASVDA